MKRNNLHRLLALSFLASAWAYSTATNPADVKALLWGAERVAMVVAWIGGVR